MTPLMKNSLAFVVFAIIAAILNAIAFPGVLGDSYAEGVGKAVPCWGLAYLITWTTRRNRSTWLFGVSLLTLVFVLFVQPILMKNMMNTPEALSMDIAASDSAPEIDQLDDATFGERVRSYLMANPEVIFEAAAVMEQRQKELQSTNEGDLTE